MRALGIDFGSRRIGIALSSGTLATPYEVLGRSGDRQRDHAAIAKLVEEADVDVVVVGLPLSLDGSTGPAARGVLKEVAQLTDALRVPVETYDERLSTVTADRQLIEQGLNAAQRRRIVDKVAASIILQAWLDSQHQTA